MSYSDPFLSHLLPLVPIPSYQYYYNYDLRNPYVYDPLNTSLNLLQATATVSAAAAAAAAVSAAAVTVCPPVTLFVMDRNGTSTASVPSAATTTARNAGALAMLMPGGVDSHTNSAYLYASAQSPQPLTTTTSQRVLLPSSHHPQASLSARMDAFHASQGVARSFAQSPAISHSRTHASMEVSAALEGEELSTSARESPPSSDFCHHSTTTTTTTTTPPAAPDGCEVDRPHTSSAGPRRSYRLRSSSSRQLSRRKTAPTENNNLVVEDTTAIVSSSSPETTASEDNDLEDYSLPDGQNMRQQAHTRSSSRKRRADSKLPAIQKRIKQEGGGSASAAAHQGETALSLSSPSSSPSSSDDPVNCCICMCEPDPKEKATINGCEGHFFCFDCIEKWADRENSCPLCKNRFTKIERLVKPRRQRGVKSTSVKRVRNRDQRTDLLVTNAAGQASNNPLQGLFANMEANMAPQIARLIFSSGTGLFPGAISNNINNNNNAATAAAAVNLLGDLSPTNNVTPYAAAAAAATTTTRRAVAANRAVAAARAAADYHQQQQRMATRSAAAAAAAHPTSVSWDHDIFFSSDDEDGGFNSDEDEAFGNFVQRVRNLERAGEGLFENIQVMRPTAAAARHQQQQQQQQQYHVSRTYASNVNDVDAGESAENALEIEDSDSSDDEVEVVRVMPPAHAAAP